jgi:hypothetical protein
MGGPLFHYTVCKELLRLRSNRLKGQRSERPSLAMLVRREMRFVQVGTRSLDKRVKP